MHTQREGPIYSVNNNNNNNNSSHPSANTHPRVKGYRYQQNPGKTVYEFTYDTKKIQCQFWKNVSKRRLAPSKPSSYFTYHQAKY